MPLSPLSRPLCLTSSICLCLSAFTLCVCVCVHARVLDIVFCLSTRGHTVVTENHTILMVVQVAVLFLTKGELFHEPTWWLWFKHAAGLVPATAIMKDADECQAAGSETRP
jgi:hypothetical protein